MAKPNEFGPGQVEKARYWYEKVPYTYYTNSLSTGRTGIFSALDIGKASKREKYGVLSDVAVTQQPNVMVNLTHNHSREQVWSQALPASMTPVLSGQDEGMRATGALSLDLINSSGAAINSTFQVNYSVAIKQMSVADKLLYGVRLTGNEPSLRDKFHLPGGGLRPLALSESVRRAWWGQVLDEEVLATVNGSQDRSIQNLSPNSNEMLIVTRIASELATGDVGNQVMLSLSRDSDTNYVQILADNMSLEHPFDVWIPARDTLNLQISADTQTENVPVQLHILRVKLTTVIRTLIGDIDPTELNKEDHTLYQQILAGVVL